MSMSMVFLKISLFIILKNSKKKNTPKIVSLVGFAQRDFLSFLLVLPVQQVGQMV